MVGGVMTLERPALPIDVHPFSCSTIGQGVHRGHVYHLGTRLHQVGQRPIGQGRPARDPGSMCPCVVRHRWPIGLGIASMATFTILEQGSTRLVEDPSGRAGLPATQDVSLRRSSSLTYWPGNRIDGHVYHLGTRLHQVGQRPTEQGRPTRHPTGGS